MQVNPSTETSITFGDLDDIRQVLLTAQTFHTGRDLSDSAANLVGEVRYRPLTKEIDRILKRIEGLISDLLMVALDEEEDLDEDEEDEVSEVPEEEPADDELDSISDNPLGTKPIKSLATPFFEDDD